MIAFAFENHEKSLAELAR